MVLETKKLGHQSERKICKLTVCYSLVILHIKEPNFVYPILILHNRSHATMHLPAAII